MKFYGQNQEDELLARAVYKIEKGVVLDIGAGDGQTLSNSRYLMEQGWAGCFVEPDYEAFAKLVALYMSNADAQLVNAAVGLDAGIAQFHKSTDSGLYSSLAPDPRFADKFLYSYYVPVVTPAQIAGLMRHGPNVISVDVEGRSFEVLCSLPIESWDVKAICVEHDDRAVEISGWGRKHSYEVAGLNAENIILVRR